MSERTQGKRVATLVVSAAALTLVIGALGHSGIVQAQAPAPAAAAATPQALAPIDMTGTWVSVVTEDWRWRMVTPPKGDVSSVPINPEGRKVADSWDPAKDTSDGNACKSYGAAALSRVPGRINVSWQDANTLKMDFDAGTQTRLLHFGDAQVPAGADAGWQGYSSATWEIAGGRGGAAAGGGGGGGGGAAAAPPAPAAGAAPAGGRGGAGGGRGAAAPPRGGDLKVDTVKMKAGYLRKNGVPYSANATMLEYWDRHREPNGDEWMTVTTIIHDPTYLMQDFITSTHFKKEPNAAKFAPKPCVAS
jgi:hypothetical protein